MSKVFEEIRDEAEKRARHSHAVETAIRLIERGKDSLEEIADIAQLPLEEVQELARKKSA